MSAQKEARAPIPWGLFGLIGLVLAVESIVARHEIGLMTYVALNARYAVAESRATNDCQVLCLGDSQVKFGLDPGTIEAGSGLRARNLAIASSPTPTSYHLLRRAVDAGARPSAVVVGHMTFANSLRKQAAAFSAFDSFTECLDLAWHGRDADYAASTLLARAFPSIRERDQIRAASRSALDPRTGPFVTPGAAFLRTWEANRGAELHAADVAFAGQLNLGLKASLYRNRWLVEPMAAQYFHRLLDLAAARGITVFWLLAPILPEAESYREAHGLSEHHTRNLRAMQAMHPNLIILDSRHSGCPASAFVDLCHLNERGAVWISDAVAAVLRKHREGRLSGVRWIDLPPYSEPSSALIARTRGRSADRDSTHWQ
jgi:hypothetical protein